MSEPTPPPVPLGLWRALLQVLMDFRRAEPWLWMGDAAASVYVDENQLPWFACVLGAGRQVYGICLYRGASGLRLFRELCNSSPDYDYSRLGYLQDAVTVWFGPKSDLDAFQIERYRSLDYAPKRGERLAWPDVRSHRPGFFPWHPEEGEVRVLLAALPAVIRLSEMVRHHPECYDEHDDNELPMLPANGAPLTIDTLEWRLWLTPEEHEPAAYAEIDEQNSFLRKAMSLPMISSLEIEIDTMFMPEAVSDGERPYFPRCILIFRADNGICSAMKLARPDEDAAQIAGNTLLNTITDLKCRPGTLLVCRQNLGIQLAPLARQLGAKIKHVSFLPSAEEFRNGMAAHMRKRRLR